MAVAPEVPDRSGGSKRLLVSARPSYGGDAIVADGRAPGGKFGGKKIFFLYVATALVSQSLVGLCFAFLSIYLPRKFSFF